MKQELGASISGETTAKRAADWIEGVLELEQSPWSCPRARPGAHLLDLVAGVGDALRDALVGADGRGELRVVLHDQLVQVTVTLLVRLLQTPLLVLPVLHVIARG